jgi:hypothetical protein
MQIQSTLPRAIKPRPTQPAPNVNNESPGASSDRFDWSDAGTIVGSTCAAGLMGAIPIYGAAANLTFANDADQEGKVLMTMANLGGIAANLSGSAILVTGMLTGRNSAVKLGATLLAGSGLVAATEMTLTNTVW